MLRRSLTLCLLTLTLSLAGCGSTGPGAAPEKPLVPVTGTVKLGGEPLASASVTFNPRNTTGGSGAYGVTDASGKYTLQHRSGQPGVEPGDYTVTISRMAMKDGSPIPAGKTAADVEAVDIVPANWRDPTANIPQNQVSVSESAKTFDFDIPKQ